MRIGAQLYTVREHCKNFEDFALSLKKVADIGYTTVQVSGTCAFDPAWLKAELDKNGLECVLTHTAPARLKEDAVQVARDHDVFGCEYVGLGSYPFREEGTPADFYSEYHAIAKALQENGVHTAVETSGYADADTFLSVCRSADLVLMDLKLYDAEAHKRYTGVSNEQILKNAAALKASGIPHVFRIPLIPAVTDTRENLAAIAAFVGDSRAELLSYNALAPAKYAGVGMVYPDWIDKEKATVPDLSLFKNAVIQK